MKKSLIAAFAVAFAAGVRADQVSSYVGAIPGAAHSKTLKVTADRIAADRNTESLVASGHVTAVSMPTRIYTDFLEKDTNGVCRSGGNTSITTCTNCSDSLHWELRGDVEYKENDYVIVRDVWLYLWNVPVFWLPYYCHSLHGGNGIQIMPGYTKRWGAYLQTKATYDLIGDPRTGKDGRWLTGATRFDLRWRNGIAFGEDLSWSLGNLGQGFAKVYYAWDEDYDRYKEHEGDGWRYSSWGSTVPYNRYGVEFGHRVDLTERDVLRGRGGVYSDSFFRKDFYRRSLLTLKNEFQELPGNEVAWEHQENVWALGASVSGPLNDFVGGTSRLPELYFDVAPTPVWTLPVDYESQTRLGYLRRDYAKYGESSEISSFNYNPGIWAEYDTIRADTYQRFSAPFKLWDSLSVVPRLAYRGTFWNDSGETSLTGRDRAGSTGDAVFRSILEGGVTFAGRGTAWISEDWQHMLEPYLDVLAQEAWYSGLGNNGRPYIFDNLDASSDWSDQFAGRSRNLPYSWYGVTPGIRNAFRQADERGSLRTVFDIDVYAALQCNSTTYTDGGDNHKLAEVGKPNYGEDNFMVVPGFRARWFAFNGVSFVSRLEYDVENNKIAQAKLGWEQELTKKFSYHVAYTGRDHRWWDYSSTPTEDGQDDRLNWADFSFVEVGFRHEICDMFGWSPYLRWDCRENEIDEVGAWFDVYRTDCLGFRFNISYENEYTRIDGSREDEDWSFGFYIYLRALGPNSGIGNMD